MSEIFIHKIEQIVLSDLENEKFGVSELASEMGLSRSQILRKIKSSTGKSANCFIRDIRLKEATKYILNTDLSVSEIAYKVGFNSPSYFNKCFLDRFGITPGEYKKTQEHNILKVNSQKSTIGKRKKINRVWFLIIIIAIVSFYSLKNSFSYPTKSKDLYSSIAILPMEDYSEHRDKGYLADGLTEAITLELSKNEAIRVISRSSAMKFKGKQILASEMANELNAELLLESSLFTDNNELKVVVQLIKPLPKEKHIWANSYQQSNSNALQLVNTISTEIAKEVFSAVKPNSDQSKSYNVNEEAFDLYLKGRHIWNNQNARYESLLNAQDYLNASIKIDPNFAPVYVTLAETFLSMNKLIGDNEKRLINRENARIAIDKAFELDQSLAEAYVTKANLIGKLDWNWEKMKTLAEKGLQLDPNNPDGHQVLSNYFIVKGDYNKAIEEALIAETLDPLNPAMGCYVAECYYIAGFYDDSISKYNEVLELYPDFGYALNGIGYAYLQSGNQDKAVDSWQKLQHVMGNDQLGQCYDSSDFEDCLNYYLENAKKNKPRFCSNPTIISSIQMIMGETAGAIEYLKIAFNYKNEDLPVMLAYPDFNSLHDHPDFVEMTQNVGVVIPN